MFPVRATTDQIPGLADELERRHRDGRDIYDEWRGGVYWLVDVPGPEHGELLVDLAVMLRPLVRAAGLRSASPVNIGINREDCRVPDLSVYRPGTPRTSPAFLATALLVVEILSPGETPKEKLGFYEAAGVKEYLEVDLGRGTAELLAISDAGLGHGTESEVLPGLVVDGRWISVGNDGLDVAEYRGQ